MTEQMKKGLTLTMIFEAESGNYGEGIGNITALKKMSRADGNLYTYISRQAMRYNIVQQMGIADTPVSGEKGTVQFTDEATIEKYPEIDFFGYMKTKAKSENDAGGAATRSAAVRLSNAISLEPYNSDLDFLTNMGLAKRGELNLPNNIAQSEIHRSFYSYTVSVDLDRIGEDGSISLPQEEKARRLCELLDTVQFLYRDIKGRRENLSPVFAIGGVYDRKNPYFEGRCQLKKQKLDCDMLKDTIESCADAKATTHIGYLRGCFANAEEIERVLQPGSVASVFAALKEEVKGYYAVIFRRVV